MTTTAAPLRPTPLKSFHAEHGAKLVEYAGWEMPLLYSPTGILEEHRQCRTAAAFFDVSHMGRFRFTGRHARRFLDHVCTRQILGMKRGQVRYSLVCNERGGCRDDVLVYCLDDDQFLMVCNAANRQKLKEHFEAVRGDLVFKFEDQTESTAMVALQGPRAMEVIAGMSREIPTLKRYQFAEKNLLVMKLLVSRTGYTGEDGVEVILGATAARAALNMFLKQGKDSPVKPCGLGARDSLRLEAGMPLYGHEIDEETDPLCAGLDFAVKLTKGDDDERAGTFIGQDALRAIAARGVAKKLVGLALEGRRAARQGMRVLCSGAPTGVVTSGCLSPTLDRSIAMAYVRPADAVLGAGVEVELAEGRVIPATIVPLPFYKRPGA